MTQELQEQLKVVAEFMGAKIRVGYKSPTRTDYTVQGEFVKDYQQDKKYKTGGVDGQMLLENVSYHTSYDWLLPVWFKFRDLPIEGPDYNAYWEIISKCILLHSNPLPAFTALYNAIVWYNGIKTK